MAEDVFSTIYLLSFLKSVYYCLCVLKKIKSRNPRLKEIVNYKTESAEWKFIAAFN